MPTATAPMVGWIESGRVGIDKGALGELHIGCISASPTACPLRGMGVPVLKMTASAHTRAMDVPSAMAI